MLEAVNMFDLGILIVTEVSLLVGAKLLKEYQ